MGEELLRIESEKKAPLQLGSATVVYDSHDDTALQVTKVQAFNTNNHDAMNLHYISVKHGHCGAVCVAQCKNRVLIARHWRLTTQSYGWEFPRGMGEDGENARDTATREFLEETGIRAQNVKILQTIHADTGILKDSIAVASITVDSIAPDNANIDWELQSMNWVSVAQLDQMIAQSLISDGITIAAYMVWKLHQS